MTSIGAAPVRRAARALEPLRYKPFRRLWAGTTISRCGSFMQIATLAWLAATQTDSALRVTLVSSAGLLPMFLLSPVAGALADRHSRRRMLIASNTGGFVVAISLAVTITAGIDAYPVLLVFALAAGSAEAISATLHHAIVPLLVPRHVMTSAVILTAIQNNTARALGPVVAGLLLAGHGAFVVFWVNAASYVLVGLAVASLPELRAERTMSDRTVWGDLAAAVRYARRTPGLLFSLQLAGTSAFLIGPVQWLAPVIVRDVLGAGAREYGVVLGAYGVGAFAAALLLLVVADDRAHGTVALTGLFCGLAGLVALALASAVLLAAVGMGLCGIASMIIMSTCIRSLHAQVHDAARGRIVGMFITTFGALAPLGVAVLGLAVDISGTRATLIASSVVVGTITALLWSTRRLAYLDHPPLHELTADAAPAASYGSR